MDFVKMAFWSFGQRHANGPSVNKIPNVQAFQTFAKDDKPPSGVTDKRNDMQIAAISKTTNVNLADTIASPKSLNIPKRSLTIKTA